MSSLIRWCTRRRFALAAVVLCVAVSASVALVQDPVVARSAIGSIASLLETRSPGERRSGALLASKQKLGENGYGPPDEVQQRALGKIFPPEVGLPLAPADLATIPILSDIPLVEGLPDIAAFPLADLGAGTPVFGLTPSSAPLLLGNGGGGGGLSGGGGPRGGGIPSPGLGTPELPVIVDTQANSPIVVTPPVAAVPEPQTWAMMIMGMFACGAAMRRNRRTAGVAARA